MREKITSRGRATEKQEPHGPKEAGLHCLKKGTGSCRLRFTKGGKRDPPLKKKKRTP